MVGDPTHQAEALQEGRGALRCWPGARVADRLLTLTVGRGMAPGCGALLLEAGQPLAAHQPVALFTPVHND